MYVRTENCEIVEVHDDYHHPDTLDILENRDDCYSELYEKLYHKPKVKPVDGTSSWQFFVERLNGAGEICIATFDTVKEANEALKSFESDIERNRGWDAIGYKGPEIVAAKLTGNQYLLNPVTELILCFRTIKFLENTNIKTIWDLVTKEEQDLFKCLNFEDFSLNEIKEELAEIGLTLGMNFDNMYKTSGFDEEV